MKVSWLHFVSFKTFYMLHFHQQKSEKFASWMFLFYLVLNSEFLYLGCQFDEDSHSGQARAELGQAKFSSIATAIASWNWSWQNQNMQMYMFAWTPISLVYLQINDFHNIFKCRAAWICTGDHNHWLHKGQKISNSILISWQGKNINISCVFDCEEEGPSFTAAIPGVYVPRGLCLADAPDLMGAKSPCPSKSSVCPDNCYPS